MKVLLPNLRTYLIGEGIVRNPDVAGPLPPLHLAPQNGLPAPGEGTEPAVGHDVVVGAYRTGGIPPRPHTAELRVQVVEFRIRARKAILAEHLETRLTAALIDRFVWPVGDLTVIESQEWRELQLLGSGPDGYSFSVAYWFQLYAAQLAGA